MTTPVNWTPGGDVIVHPSVQTEDARKIYPNLVEHKVSVLRYGYLAAHGDWSMLALPQDNVAACIKGDMKEIQLWNPVSLYYICLPWQHEPSFVRGNEEYLNHKMRGGIVM